MNTKSAREGNLTMRLAALAMGGKLATLLIAAQIPSMPRIPTYQPPRAFTPPTIPRYSPPPMPIYSPPVPRVDTQPMRLQANNTAMNQMQLGLALRQTQRTQQEMNWARRSSQSAQSLANSQWSIRQAQQQAGWWRQQAPLRVERAATSLPEPPAVPRAKPGQTGDRKSTTPAQFLPTQRGALPAGTEFYFPNDAYRRYRWITETDGLARNLVNGIVARIPDWAVVLRAQWGFGLCRGDRSSGFRPSVRPHNEGGWG